MKNIANFGHFVKLTDDFFWGMIKENFCVSMKRFQLFLMVLQVPVDFFLLLCGAISAFFLRFTPWAVGLRPVAFDLTLFEYIQRASGFALLSLLFFALLGLYHPNPNKKLAADIVRVFLALSSCLAVVALYIMFTQQLFDSRFLVAASWIFGIVYVSIGRICMWSIRRMCFRMGIGQRKVVIIGSDPVAKELQHVLSSQPELGYALTYTFEKFDAKTKSILEKNTVDEIIFSYPRAHEKEALQALQFADANHIIFKYSADLFATLSANTAMYPIGSVPIVELKRTRLDGWGAILKRIFDIVASLIFIVLFSPLMLFTAVAIKFTSKGPVFFTYKRIGKFGKPFTYFKFRSMYDGAHTKRYDPEFRKDVKDLRGWNEKNPIVKYENDPRITPVGRFIRRYSIDELPEFFLVLRGSMSLVGPRPHEKEEVEKYEDAHKKVLFLKPGITGMAQVSGRSDLEFDEEVKLDVLYIEKWSLLLDIIILFKTPLVLLKKRKAL